MNKGFVLWLLALVLAAACGAVAWAAVPNQLSYQGRLTNNSGAPLSGNFALTFRIYSNQSGGNALWSETHDAVLISDGFFAVTLGSLVPIGSTVFNSGTAFLGIAVSGGVELSPRQPIVAAAYALRVATVDEAIGGQLNSSLNVLGSVAASDSLTARIGRLGSPSTSGELNLFRSGSSNPTSRIDATNFGGRFRLYDGTAAPSVELSTDVSVGGGGYGFIARNDDGAPAAVFDGNYQGSEAPVFILTGPQRSCFFDMSSADDDAVELPANCISSFETANEAGVASTTVADAAITTVLQSLASRTIVCPSNGYIIVLASAQLEVSHSAGVADDLRFAISDNAATIPTNQDFRLVLPAALASATMNQPLSLHGQFVAAAGERSVHLLGRTDSGGNATLSDINLTAIFVPTWYGGARSETAASADQSELERLIAEAVRRELDTRAARLRSRAAQAADQRR